MTSPRKHLHGTYGHELGRAHVNQVFKDRLETCCIENVTVENAYEVIDLAIHDGNDVIFTTTPQLRAASLKAAIDHPDVKILNCSLNTATDISVHITAECTRQNS